MITGRVTADREALIRLTVYATNGRPHEIEALVDTGYSGRLTLPPDLIVMLKLPWRGSGRAILADGSTHPFTMYEATLLWEGRKVGIPVGEADTEPMIGMKLMKGYDIHIRNVDGGTVTLNKIRDSGP
jgi:clan AA aspartic protease